MLPAPVVIREEFQYLLTFLKASPSEPEWTQSLLSCSRTLSLLGAGRHHLHSNKSTYASVHQGNALENEWAEHWQSAEQVT